MSFTNYINTLLEEKNIDQESHLNFESNDLAHIMPIACVVEFINTLPDHAKEQIKKTLVMIDYKNGDVKHFLTYIAKGMVAPPQ